MPTNPPPAPKIYHIVHWDKLASIANEGKILSDKILRNSPRSGSEIGMSHIKDRRLGLPLSSRPGLCVGECVPFYFCPRSVMLYLIHKKSPDLTYQGGQEPIVHLVADLRATVSWADANNKRWAFTLSNAASFHFEDYCDLANLDKINWAAVNAIMWDRAKEEKQAEFLIEDEFPWHLIEKIVTYNPATENIVKQAIHGVSWQTPISVNRAYYYDY